MQNVTKQGVGLIKRLAQIISKEQENSLWESGILGIDRRDTPLKTVFWTVGVNFGLRGGDEHRNLSRDNFKILKDEDGVRCLEYTESISKTFKGEIKHRKIDPHRARACEIPNSNRCPVNIFEKCFGVKPKLSRIFILLSSALKADRKCLVLASTRRS